jgi:hypothetical protein
MACIYLTILRTRGHVTCELGKFTFRLDALSANFGSIVLKPRLNLDQVVGCEYLHYPWDDWERWAIDQGLNPDLAGLGRAVIREASQHCWTDRLQSLCGWHDDGRRMLRLALRSPEKARKRWERLLETDGYRGEYDEKTGEWISFV